jgi:glyoxylate reductase
MASTPGPRIVVTRRIPDPALELLREESDDVWVSPHDRPMTTEELHEAVAGADAILTLLHDRVDSAFLDAAGPQLAVLSNVAVGYDNVDVPAVIDHGVIFTNTPGVLTEATADIAFGLILMSTRRLAEGERMIRNGGSWSWNMFFMLGMGLQEKTLGIVGLGQIGVATARRAKAFGMNISYTGRRRAAPAVEAELDATYIHSVDDLLATADVVSLHCPLSDETRHLMDARRLALMKPTAYLINTTRGPVVDEAALAEALAAGTIAGAGLDVFEKEPEVHPALLAFDNVTLIPHLGSATIETRTAMGVLAARNAVAVLRGQAPLTPVT